MKATINIEKITPTQAEMMLENLFPLQRNYRQRNGDEYAKMMANGEWCLSPDAILLIKGMLANGQHRLQALMLSGTTQEFLVMRSDDENLYKKIDSGMKRSIGDTVGKLVENANHIAAMAQFIIDYKTGNIFPRGKKTNTDRVQIINFINDNNNELQKCLRLVKQLLDKQRIIAYSRLASILFLAAEKNPVTAEQFITELSSGRTTNENIVKLRSRLVSNATSKSKLPQNYLSALVIKAYAAFKSGTQLGVLKMVNGEEYPVIP